MRKSSRTPSQSPAFGCADPGARDAVSANPSLTTMGDPSKRTNSVRVWPDRRTSIDRTAVPTSREPGASVSLSVPRRASHWATDACSSLVCARSSARRHRRRRTCRQRLGVERPTSCTRRQTKATGSMRPPGWRASACTGRGRDGSGTTLMQSGEFSRSRDVATKSWVLSAASVKARAPRAAEVSIAIHVRCCTCLPRAVSAKHRFPRHSRRQPTPVNPGRLSVRRCGKSMPLSRSLTCAPWTSGLPEAWSSRV